MKFKHVNLTDLEVKSDGSTAAIEGYGSVFGNRDDHGDIVMPGAFMESIKSRMPAMLYQHDQKKIAGVWEIVAEDSKGLHMKGKTLDTTLGRDVAEEIRSGAIKGLSIGYRVKSGGAIYEKNTRFLKALDLYETSLVTFPSNEASTITSVKAAMESMDAVADLIEQCLLVPFDSVTKESFADMQQKLTAAFNLLDEPEDGDIEKSQEMRNPRTLERVLREAGLSKRDARGIIAKGYNSIIEERCDADPEEIKAIINLTNKLKGL